MVELTRIEVDGPALIRTKRRSRKAFEALVKRLRRQGISDREIMQAMAKSKMVINPLRLSQ